METLTKMAAEGFISVVQFVIAGIDSYGGSEWLRVTTRSGDGCEVRRLYRLSSHLLLPEPVSEYPDDCAPECDRAGEQHAVERSVREDSELATVQQQVGRRVVETHSLHLFSRSKCRRALLRSGGVYADPRGHREAKGVDD